MDSSERRGGTRQVSRAVRTGLVFLWSHILRRVLRVPGKWANPLRFCFIYIACYVPFLSTREKEENVNTYVTLCTGCYSECFCIDPLILLS